jgi:hypothetical protein
MGAVNFVHYCFDCRVGTIVCGSGVEKAEVKVSFNFTFITYFSSFFLIVVNAIF